MENSRLCCHACGSVQRPGGIHRSFLDDVRAAPGARRTADVNVRPPFEIQYLHDNREPSLRDCRRERGILREREENLT